MSVNKKNVWETNDASPREIILGYMKNEVNASSLVKWGTIKAAEPFLVATLYLNKNKGESSAQTLASNDAYGLRIDVIYVENR